MKIGIVGTPGGWSSEKLADTAQKVTGYRLLINMDDVFWDSEKESVYCHQLDLSDLDALIIKKIGANYSADLPHRLYLLDYLHKRGLMIFSKPSAIMPALNRLSCTLLLKAAGIPMPSMVVTENIKKAYEAVHSFGKAVLKPLFSSKARGMIVISGHDPELMKKLTVFRDSGNKLMYIQKFINMPGRDLGVVFLGGEYLATYSRVNDGLSWHTTTDSGGRYAPCKPDDSVINIAQKAQSLFGLDYTGVDIVETKEGPLVFEVSAFGGFRGLHESYGIDAAEKYLSYVLEKIKCTAAT